MAQEFSAEKTPDVKKVPKRIAFITKHTGARMNEDEREMVMTVPHLLIREIIAFEIMVVVLAVLSLTFNAPLEWIANPEHTPNPAKAPWYFLGLQELLHYFPPVVGGVVIPGLLVLALVAIPYFRINRIHDPLWMNHSSKSLRLFLVPSIILIVFLALEGVWAMAVPTIVVSAMMMLVYFRPEAKGALGWLVGRPLSWWIMTWFVIICVVLTAIGTLFRGPEWSWTWPWDHIY